jgi:microcystin degradation protein MlrC
MPATRVLVGQVWLESHSFNPIPTRAEDFALERGAELLAANRAAGSALGGILRAGDAAGVAWVPTVAARARPGGPAEEDFFAGLLETMLAAGPVDAVCLELHGAMVSTAREDCEGELLAALRAKLGPEVPIAAALDLHAQVTPAMVAASDVLVAYKTNPHADMAETGAKAFALLQQILETGRRPARALCNLPFLTRGNDETATGPLAELHARARMLCETTEGMHDLSICNVNPFLDVDPLGQSVLATADTEAAAEAAAREIGRALWDRRDAFVQDLPDMAEALRRVRDEPQARPFVLGDQGDRVLAGAPGDATALPRLALEAFPELRLAVPLYDPAAAEACFAAGLDADVALAVGGHVSPGQTPLQVRGQVRALGPGRYVHRGAYMTGVPVELGRTAVLQAGKLALLLTSRAPFVQDPAAFEDHGLPLSEFDALVVKSGYHYKLAFGTEATPMTVDTPGLGAYRPHELPFRRGRPLHPLDSVELSELPLQLFSGRASDR